MLPVSHSACIMTNHDKRKILLAVTGLSPTCRSLPDTLIDAAVGDGFGLLVDGAGAAALGVGAALPGA